VYTYGAEWLSLKVARPLHELILLYALFVFTYAIYVLFGDSCFAVGTTVHIVGIVPWKRRRNYTVQKYQYDEQVPKNIRDLRKIGKMSSSLTPKRTGLWESSLQRGNTHRPVTSDVRHGLFCYMLRVTFSEDEI
jgi:hypothetical protein